MLSPFPRIQLVRGSGQLWARAASLCPNRALVVSYPNPTSPDHLAEEKQRENNTGG
jgi:hypothetical protein